MIACCLMHIVNIQARLTLICVIVAVLIRRRCCIWLGIALHLAPSGNPYCRRTNGLFFSLYLFFSCFRLTLKVRSVSATHRYAGLWCFLQRYGIYEKLVMMHVLVIFHSQLMRFIGRLWPLLTTWQLSQPTLTAVIWIPLMAVGSVLHRDTTNLKLMEVFEIDVMPLVAFYIIMQGSGCGDLLAGWLLHFLSILSLLQFMRGYQQYMLRAC